MNKYADRYKKLATIQLLQIVENSEEYNSEAVEAATLEISSRNLSDEEIQEDLSKIESSKNQKSKTEELISNFGKKIIDEVNPVQTKTRDADKLIKALTIFFGIMSVFQIYEAIPLLRLIVSSGGTRVDLGSIFILGTTIIAPIGTVLFWQRKQRGWHLLMLHSMIITTSTIGIAIFSLVKGYGFSFIAETIVILGLYGAAIWTLSKTEIKEEYEMTDAAFKKSIFLTIIFSIMVLLVLVFS